jgi:hypothetical protein
VALHDSRLKLKGFIHDFTEWGTTIYSFVEKFHKKHNVYPNIFLASRATFDKIDFYAQIHPEIIFILEDDGSSKNIDMNEYSGINRIEFPDCTLDFCIDFEASLGDITLMYDEAPDFSGEPIPEEEVKETKSVLQLKKSA